MVARCNALCQNLQATKMTQKERIKELFIGSPNVWVGLPVILNMSPRIAQNGPRITELRASGMNIINKTKLPLISSLENNFLIILKEDCKSNKN